ncbi:MAG TPA: HPr-rel-A system PqqD family peptide chaperone [Thiolapillus brandeum]|uniref:HPr-rel-A system PqqD family peptide chaperone n=1 Tax=Thiolapillus brandeum TaxID=1076588 RepID=A0A7C5IXY2_9GAMM|nr:HPr-rel-A system PqqD family peptide chaperone [Thiolapillus brandeum]
MSAFSWQAVAADDLLWEAWEEAFTVYHRATGETHLLNVLPVEILSLLQERPRSTEEIAAELAARCEVANDGPWHRRVADILEELEALSLVEPVDR